MSTPAAGILLAIDQDSKQILKLPCLSADMVFPGWMRIVLEPGHSKKQSTVSWWQVPADTKFVEWQPGGAL